MAKQTGTADEAEAAVERIRELNEQILEFGRKAGTQFLEAYEANLKSFAEYQDKVADTSQVDWIASLARAQANFTREVSAAYAASAREFLK
jgi:aminoglycoside N3'-acetyltransferase